MQKRIVKLLSLLLICAIGFFLGWELLKNWEAIRAYPFIFNFKILLLASFLYALSYIPLGIGWHLILNYIKNPIPFFETFLYFCITQPAKYIPGKIWTAVARMKFCKTHDVPNSITLLTTGLEAIMEIFAGTYISLLAIFQMNLLGKFSFWGSIILTCLGLLLLYPRIFYSLINIYLKIAKHGPLEKNQQVSFSKLLLLQIVYIAGIFLSSLAQVFFLNSFEPIGASDFPLLIGVGAFSTVASIFAVFTPSGLGVREGVWFLALKRSITSPGALIFSFASRIWMIAVEALMLFAAAPVLWMKRRKRSTFAAALEKEPVDVV